MPAVARLSRSLALTAEELDELLATSWNMRLATQGPGHRINVTPLWFVWVGGRIYTFCRGQKVVNLRRNPHATVLVDRNERFPELQGAMLQGTATILDDAQAEAADAHLSEARALMGRKYNGGYGRPPQTDPPPFPGTATGSTWRWVVFVPINVVTWDNTKL